MSDEEHEDLLGEASSGHDSDGDHSDINIQERPTTNVIIKQYGAIGFLLSGFALSLSSFFVMILLPLSMASSAKVGDGKAVLFLLAFLSSLILLLITLLRGALSGNIRQSIKPPLGLKKTLHISCLFSLSGILVVLAQDDYKVLCHLQDPMKGLVLVFALTYYFIFCKRPMSVSQMFSVAAVIIGLFVAADFGLCDRFRCRGLLHIDPRERTGKMAHWFWTIAYTIGLGLWTLFYTSLEGSFHNKEEILVASSVKSEPELTETPASERVSTVSRLVSSRDPPSLLENIPSGHNKNPISIITLAFWNYVIAFFIVILLMAICIPIWSEMFSPIIQSLSCLFHWNSTPLCHEWTRYGLLIVLSHLALVLTSLDFLRRSQCAVMVITMTAPALPLAGLWWSLFTLDPFHESGVMIRWTPEVTGELICSLLGLPVVLCGVFLVIRSHLRASQISPVALNCQE